MPVCLLGVAGLDCSDNTAKFLDGFFVDPMTQDPLKVPRSQLVNSSGSVADEWGLHAETRIVECPEPEACIATDDHRSLSCAEGYEG